MIQDLTELFEAAVQAGASDIHLSRTAEGGVVRFRCFGTLSEVGVLSVQGILHLTSLLKLHAHLDISKSGFPQDGRVKWVCAGQSVDIRVSSLPTLYGEDFVCRFFEDRSDVVDLGQLGFSEPARAMVEGMLSHRSGLILVTGATGSGKTTTLYTCLRTLLARGFCNIVTLEDPIEADISGVRQSQVNTGIGYDFVQGLRAILRQDPDVIMVGEIRDRETAKTALEAAYTGHLVLSTLHTPDCATSLLRLASFDLDPFWVQQCLKGIVSQTLVRGVGSVGRLAVTEVLEPGAQVETLRVFDPSAAKHYYSFEEDIAWKVAAGWVQAGTVLA